MSAESLCRKDREFQPLKLSTFPDSRRASAARFVLTGAVICALPSFASGYAMTITVEVMIAGVFASGINLLIGYTGLVSLGQAMFLGLGGYGIAVGTALGFIWVDRLTGQYWYYDPKYVVTILVLLLYAAYLQLARSTAWRGARASRLCIFNFVVVILSFTVVNLYLSHTHRYF